MKNIAINSATFSLKNLTFTKALNLALRHQLDVEVGYSEMANEYTLSVSLFNDKNRIIKRVVLFSDNESARMSKTFRTNNTNRFITELKNIIASNNVVKSEISDKNLASLKSMLGTSIDNMLTFSILYYADGSMHIKSNKNREDILNRDLDDISISEFHKEFNNILSAK